MSVPKTFASAAAAALLLLAQSAACRAAEVVVLSSGASRSAISELVTRFAAGTEHRVAIRFANNPILKKQIEEGEGFDVVIIEPDMIDALAAAGHILKGSRIDLARVGMALGARAGSPPAETSSVEAFASVLKNADSIAYTADGHSGRVFLRTLEQLGLLETLKPRLRPAVGRTASSLVLKGEAQLWAGPISTPASGTRMIGRFPAEIQTYVGISAAIGAKAREADFGRSFIRFLATEEAQAVFAAKGFQPLPAR
jgi:molybdate transport system substrate-binding protein